MTLQIRYDSGANRPASPAPLSRKQREIQARLFGTNIDSESFLATDYLNHFNEVVMLLDMLHELPEMLEEARAWRPKSYIAHFSESRLADRKLAIEAYRHAPAQYRTSFDRAVGELNHMIFETIAALTPLGNDPATLAQVLEDPLAQIKAKLATLNAIIHGKLHALDQSGIDQAFEREAEPSGGAERQADIDALFD